MHTLKHLFLVSFIFLYRLDDRFIFMHLFRVLADSELLIVIPDGSKKIYESNINQQ